MGTNSKERTLYITTEKINLTLSCQHTHHITDGLDWKKYTAVCPLRVPEEPNSNLPTSKSQQPLQPPDLPHTCLHFAVMSCHLHSLRGITPRGSQLIPVPKTFGGSSSWSPLSPHQLLYSYINIYNRSFTHTMKAMVLWCTST